MSGLKEVRLRLLSVKSTRQITSAMKMVSAAKLRKTQNSLLQARTYEEKLSEIIFELINKIEIKNKYIENREFNRILLIVITSNKGLCGAYNVNTCKKVLELINDYYYEQYNNNQLEVYVIGNKGEEYLKNRNIKISRTFHYIIDKPVYAEVLKLLDEIVINFFDKKFDRVEIVYNYFKNPVIHDLVSEQFLPLKKSSIEKPYTNHIDWILEPSGELILEKIIPEYLRIKFYKIILESLASEHGSRMTAMHQATDNAESLIKELQIAYNKARQDSITREIVEITSGAEALRKYFK